MKKSGAVIANENFRNISFTDLNKLHAFFAANLPPLLKISLLVFDESSPLQTKDLCDITIFVLWASLKFWKDLPVVKIIEHPMLFCTLLLMYR